MIYILPGIPLPRCEQRVVQGVEDFCPGSFSLSSSRSIRVAPGGGADVVREHTVALLLVSPPTPETVSQQITKKNGRFVFGNVQPDAILHTFGVSLEKIGPPTGIQTGALVPAR